MSVTEMIILQTETVTKETVNVLAQYRAIGVMLIILIAAGFLIARWFLLKYLPSITETFRDGFTKLNATIEKAEQDRVAAQAKSDKARDSQWASALAQIDRISGTVDSIAPSVTSFEIRLDQAEKERLRMQSQIDRLLNKD